MEVIGKGKGFGSSTLRSTSTGVPIVKIQIPVSVKLSKTLNGTSLLYRIIRVSLPSTDCPGEKLPELAGTGSESESTGSCLTTPTSRYVLRQFHISFLPNIYLLKQIFIWLIFFQKIQIYSYNFLFCKKRNECRHNFAALQASTICGLGIFSDLVPPRICSPPPQKKIKSLLLLFKLTFSFIKTDGLVMLKFTVNQYCIKRIDYLKFYIN